MTDDRPRPHADTAGGVLAVDIGGTKLALRAVAAGTTVHERTVPWPAGDDAEADSELLEACVAEAIAALPGAPVRIGVAAAPNVGADATVLSWPNRPTWVGRSLSAPFTGSGAEVLFGDDATLAALAEAVSTAGRDLAYLGIGTGVGGGLVSGGRLLTGAWGTAGELGHLVTDPRGPRCRCGTRGCLQAVVSAEALAAHATAARGLPTSSAELVAGVERAEPWAERTLDHAADSIAGALRVLAELVQPAQIRIGGGLGAALAPLPGRVARRLAATARPGRPLPEVGPAVHGPHSSLAGAALLAARGPHVLNGADLFHEGSPP
ncbi:ROK family protein [Streptomyces asoensis]|uniref:Kanosamine kinase n=1 Tax=Streptomyces asoensis TaxID=249586 RepID=A0ABQ3S516_9ACTN|nr:ROK family protein [Streptomyces asoensis]GGQ66253.1 kanosamine kinase [Streptomyces asoensis]GHI63105.1 kanosamine kinase [Streptomyces asoensis]